MRTDKLLTRTEVASFLSVATGLLIEKYGENWLDRFQASKDGEKKSKPFSLPVLAHIVSDNLASDDATMPKRKLANMVLNKIHDDNIHHVLNLLETFLSEREMDGYFKSIQKNDLPEKAYNIVSKLKTAA